MAFSGGAGASAGHEIRKARSQKIPQNLANIMHKCLRSLLEMNGTTMLVTCTGGGGELGAWNRERSGPVPLAVKPQQTPTNMAAKYGREHSFKLMSQMQHLRKQQVMCDTKMNIGGQIFPIHRVVLAAASPYFKVMFTSDMAESREDTINIHGVEANTFATVLDFIYCGHVEVCEENVLQLLPSAKMFHLDDLEGFCGEFLKHQLDPSNCVGIYLFAEAHSSEKLSEVALEYVHRNFVQVTEQEEFLELDQVHMLQFLESEELNIQSEAQVFEAAMKWVLHDVPKRRGALGKVLERVRLPLISSKHLQNYSKSCEDSSLQRMLDNMLENYRSYQLITGGVKQMQLQPRRATRKGFFVVGGYSQLPGGRWDDTLFATSVERFDPLSLKVDANSQADLTYPRSGHGVVTVGGLIYAIGGEVDSLVYDVTECYDPAQNQWSVVAPLRAPRVAFGLCVVEDYIFVIGGWVGSELGVDIERYDPQKGCWEIVGRAETKRYNLGVAQVEGIIYVVGGFSELSDALQLVESYNPVTEKWTRLANMHISRAFHGLTSMDRHLYAVGGSNERDGTLRSVERYDVDTNQWTEVTSLDRPRSSLSVAVNHGQLYVIGGQTESDQYSPPATLTSIDVFDPKENKWKHVADLSLSRCEFGVAVL